MLLHDSAVWPDCRAADCSKWSIINRREWCKTSCSNHLVCNVKLVRTKSGWVSLDCGKRNLGSASEIVGSWNISCEEGKQSLVFGWATRDPRHQVQTMILRHWSEQRVLVADWQCWNQCWLMSGPWQGSEKQVGRGHWQRRGDICGVTILSGSYASCATTTHISLTQHFSWLRSSSVLCHAKHIAVTDQSYPCDVSSEIPT